MAAVVHPHRLAPTAARRPDLRVLPGGRSTVAPAPLAITPAAVAGVLLALVLVVVGVLALGRGAFADLAPAPAVPAAAAAAPEGARTVTVRSGDTLWGIARRIQPTGDVRPLVDRLVAANGSPIVVPGTELVVPG